MSKTNNNKLVKAKKLLKCIESANESIKDGDYINDEFVNMIDDLNEAISTYKLESKSFMWLAEELIYIINDYKDSWQEDSKNNLLLMINDWFNQEKDIYFDDPDLIDLEKVPTECWDDIYECYYSYEGGYDWNNAEEALYELDSYGFYCTMLGY